MTMPPRPPIPDRPMEGDPAGGTFGPSGSIRGLAVGVVALAFAVF